MIKLEVESRYDRQLRLWEDGGQSRIEKAHIHLLHLTPTITEILKNLVLAGIGSYSVDSLVFNRVIREEDSDSNFFLPPDQIGQLVGNVIIFQMQQLNCSVQFFKDYDLAKTAPTFIVTRKGRNDLMQFMQKNIPILEVLEGGPFAAIRLTKMEHFGTNGSSCFHF